MPEKKESRPLSCFHCKKEFPHGHALMAHLAHCKERKLHRKFVVGDYQFDVVMNPLRRNVKALRDLESELKGVAPEKAFAGALMVMRNGGYIFEFSAKKKDSAG